MVRIETPTETLARARTPGGTPSRPPSAIDRVLYIAPPSKSSLVNSFPPPKEKASRRPFFHHSARFFDEVVSLLIAELNK